MYQGGAGEREMTGVQTRACPTPLFSTHGSQRSTEAGCSRRDLSPLLRETPGFPPSGDLALERGLTQPIRSFCLEPLAYQLRRPRITWPIRCDHPNLFSQPDAPPWSSQPVRCTGPELLGKSVCPGPGGLQVSWLGHRALRGPAAAASATPAATLAARQ